MMRMPLSAISMFDLRGYGREFVKLEYCRIYISRCRRTLNSSWCWLNIKQTFKQRRKCFIGTFYFVIQNNLHNVNKQ